MPITKAFKSGNSQAVRIPSELAFADINQELGITRLGDVITIRPTTPSRRETIAILRLMISADWDSEAPIELPDRRWDR